jgi:hypothetical protein
LLVKEVLTGSDRHGSIGMAQQVDRLVGLNSLVMLVPTTTPRGVKVTLCFWLGRLMVALIHSVRDTGMPTGLLHTVTRFKGANSCMGTVLRRRSGGAVEKLMGPMVNL